MNMLNSADYCSFDLTWNCSQDPGYLVSYTVVQDASDDWLATIPDFPASKETLHCNNNADIKSPAELRCKCKPHHAVSFLGIDVISESRIVEVYSDMDGYLKSSRGDLLPESATNDKENNVKLFNCRINVDEPVDSVTLKFLGLGGGTSFTINRLHFALVQRQALGAGQSDTGIDLTKVKGYLHSMGDVMPDSARDLLNSVEKYQQTQMVGMASLQNMLTGSRSQGGQLGGLGQLTGLLSMFSNFTSNGMVSQRTKNHSNHKDVGEGSRSRSEKWDQTEIDAHHQNQGQPKIEQSSENNLRGEHQDKEDKMGQSNTCVSSPLEQLLRKPLTSQGHDVKSQGEVGQDDMFKMLQSVCGSVSALRVQPQIPEREETEMQDKDREENESKTQPSVTSDKNDLSNVIEQTVLQEVQNCEQRIKDHIDTSLVAMETRINSKLDSILDFLHKKTESET